MLEIERVITGLRHRKLPADLLYNARGLTLFSAITALPEYYPARSETALIAAHAADLADIVPRGGSFIDYGGSSPDKAAPLLHRLAPARYVPVDSAPDAFRDADSRYRGKGFRVHPVVADIRRNTVLPAEVRGGSLLGFTAGTFCNMEADEVRLSLRCIHRTLGLGARLLVAIDMCKDEGRLTSAYNDRAGRSAAFLMNVLMRLNEEGGADFKLNSFSAEGRWNAAQSRMEMGLVSRTRQSARVGGERFDYGPGDRIDIIFSYRYTVEEFVVLSEDSGWVRERDWANADSGLILFQG